MTNETIEIACQHAQNFKGYQIDTKNHIIIFAFDKGITEKDIMQSGMLGEWFVNNGFNVSITTGDYEYNQREKRETFAGNNKYNTKKIILKNRVILSATW